MSNELVRAGHGLSLVEKRIVMAAVAKLDSRNESEPHQVLQTRLHASEYAATYGVDHRTAYEALAEAAARLYERSITFYEPAHTRRGRRSSAATVTHMRWVAAVSYKESAGWIELTWNPRLWQHLLGLRQRFTSYQLHQASDLRSAYAWRLLELLMQYQATGVAEYEIEDLHLSLDVPPSIRQDTGQLRRYVLEPAIRELTERDGWQIEMTPLKRGGKRVAALRFEFRREPPRMPVSAPPFPS